MPISIGFPTSEELERFAWWALLMQEIRMFTSFIDVKIGKKRRQAQERLAETRIGKNRRQAQEFEYPQSRNVSTPLYRPTLSNEANSEANSEAN